MVGLYPVDGMIRVNSMNNDRVYLCNAAWNVGRHNHTYIEVHEVCTNQNSQKIERPTSGHSKKEISPECYNPIHAMVTLLYRTLQSTVGYDTLIWRTCMVMAAGRNLAFKIAAKLLQIETWIESL